jgi:hypothetical protein
MILTLHPCQPQVEVEGLLNVASVKLCLVNQLPSDAVKEQLIMLKLCMRRQGRKTDDGNSRLTWGEIVEQLTIDWAQTATFGRNRNWEI